jgi:hypothetical protein
MGHGFVQKLVVGRPGFEARRTGRRAGSPRRPQLARVEAPSGRPPHRRPVRRRLGRAPRHGAPAPRRAPPSPGYSTSTTAGCSAWRPASSTGATPRRPSPPPRSSRAGPTTYRRSRWHRRLRLPPRHAGSGVAHGRRVARRRARRLGARRSTAGGARLRPRCRVLHATHSGARLTRHIARRPTGAPRG